MDLLRKDKSGRGGLILNIASITALGAHFWLPIYAGSKHAVLGFTRSMVNEAFHAKTGISFITVCPGITKTALVDEANYYGKYLFQEMIDEVKSIVNGFNRQGAAAVGKCVETALLDGENGAVWQVENDRIEKLSIKEYPPF